MCYFVAFLERMLFFMTLQYILSYIKIILSTRNF